MTTTPNESTVDSSKGLQAPDPRPDLFHVLDEVARLLNDVAAGGEQNLARPTPCSEFDVAALIEHMIFVANRVGHIGDGGHFADVEPVVLAELDDPAAAFVGAAAAIKEAWADAAKLPQMFELPWGPVPGFAALMAYTSEFAVHGWDLAKAVDIQFDPGDDRLADALAGVYNIPAEGRTDAGIPFDPVTEAPVGASNLERIAAWTGRDLSWSAA